MSDYTVDFIGEFDKEMLTKFAKSLEEIVKSEPAPKGKVVRININSPGGYVHILFDVLAYIDFMKKKGFKFETYNMDWAASCASVLFSVGHRRITHPLAKLLIHQVSFGVSGELSDIERQVAESKQINSRLFDILAKNLNYSKSKMLSKCQGVDWIMDAGEAYALKFTHDIDVL